MGNSFVDQLKVGLDILSATCEVDFLVIENDNEVSLYENDIMTYTKAMSHDSEKWYSTIKFDLDSMYINKVRG